MRSMNVLTAMLAAALASSARGPYTAPTITTHDPRSGRYLHKQSRGNRAVQRAAVKARNVKRHRAACRG